MKKSIFVAAIALVLGFSALTHAYLNNNGNNLIYDTDLNITWWNPSKEEQTNRAPWPPYFYNLAPWVTTVTVGGVSGRRLAKIGDEPTLGDETWRWGYNNITIRSKMGHLFYAELGNKGFYAPDGSYPQPGWGLANVGPFSNLYTTGEYWSSTKYTGSPAQWVFSFRTGSLGIEPWAGGDYIRLGHDGNIGAPVPIPAPILLLGSGLLVLVELRRKLKR